MSAMTRGYTRCTGTLREQLRCAQCNAVDGPQHFAEEAAGVGKRAQNQESREAF